MTVKREAMTAPLTDEQLIAALRSHAEISSPGPMMSTVREHVAWVAADVLEEADTDARLHRAELTKARAEIERLRAALRAALVVGEIKFGTNALAQSVGEKIRTALAPEGKEG